jgi:hypothetical protein
MPWILTESVAAAREIQGNSRGYCLETGKNAVISICFAGAKDGRRPPKSAFYRTTESLIFGRKAQLLSADRSQPNVRFFPHMELDAGKCPK